MYVYWVYHEMPNKSNYLKTVNIGLTRTSKRTLGTCLLASALHKNKVPGYLIESVQQETSKYKIFNMETKLKFNIKVIETGYIQHIK
jgi:hypothetical protein